MENKIIDIIEESDDDDNPIRRSKRYLFHQFQDLPLPKQALAKSVIFRLLVQATGLFVKEDNDEVKTHAMSVEKINIPLLDHYYFNRE